MSVIASNELVDAGGARARDVDVDVDAGVDVRQVVVARPIQHRADEEIVAWADGAYGGVVAASLGAPSTR